MRLILLLLAVAVLALVVLKSVDPVTKKRLKILLGAFIAVMIFLLLFILTSSP